MSAMPATMAAPPGATSMPDLNRSHPFTCVTCAIAFRSSRMQRDHMRSDWHRYNLKRRVASLPPLSSEIFAEKVLSAQATDSAEAARASFEKVCQACQKTYYSENAYQNHLGSQRHRSRAAMDGSTTDGEPSTPSVISSTISLGDPIETTAPESVEDPEVEAAFSEVVRGMKRTQLKGDASNEDSSDDEDGTERSSRSQRPTSSATPSSVDTKTSTAMPLSRCLFCNYDSPTFKLNLEHMTKYHAMFIPEQAYLADLEGLIVYLQAKVSENYECLFCHKLKASVGGVQTHMRDKGHTMIAFDSEEEMLEIGQFYDFRSTYSDSDEEEDSDTETVSSTSTAGPASKQKKKAGTKLGAPRNSADTEGKEEGWETDSDEDEDLSSDSDDDEAEAAGKKTRHGRVRRSRTAAYRDGHELHLPSGRTAGHRSLARYYRQNLRDYPSAAERAEQAQRLLENTASDDDETTEENGKKQVISRAEGGQGMIGVSDATKRRVAAVAQKQMRKAQRDDAQHQWRIERRANNQKYFRDDNFGIRI